MGAPPNMTGSWHRSANAASGAEGMSEIVDKPQAARPAADWICVAAARNILVVDDNDRHLDILSTILTSVGHDVETCGSGSEALRRLESRHYDVVVLDLVMPEVGGL